VLNGALYALVALSLVLVFAVTRVILIPMGEWVMYAPLTQAAFLEGRLPGTVWLSVVLLVFWAAVDRRRGRTPLVLLVLAAAVAGLGLAGPRLPALAGVLALLVVLPIGPASFRLFFEPLPQGSVLLYLILAVGLHFVYKGLGLAFFGPDQFRLPALLPGEAQVLGLPVPDQGLLLVVAALVVMGALAFFFARSLYGKALRAAAVNRLGARISGISVREAGRVAFLLATGVGALAGLIAAPLTNASYDMGFLLGLKGFVAAILGAGELPPGGLRRGAGGAPRGL
jgi:branched-chain amino acid transport system permease protein